MSTQDDKLDELADRLTEQALCEVLGGESPPDLSARILSAVAESQDAAIQNTSVRNHRTNEEAETMSRRPRFRLAIAASLLLAVGGTVIALVLPATQSARQASLPSAYYGQDSVSYIPSDETLPSDAFAEPLLQGAGTQINTDDTEKQSQSVTNDGAPPTSQKTDSEFVERLLTIERSTIPFSDDRPTASPSGDAGNYESWEDLKRSRAGKPVPPDDGRRQLNFVPLASRADESNRPSASGSIALDPAGNFTADLDIPFSQNSISKTVPTSGGMARDREESIRRKLSTARNARSEVTDLATLLPTSGRVMAELSHDRRGGSRDHFYFDSFQLGVNGAIRRQAGEAGEGTGPGDPGDNYTRIVENDFLKVTDSPLSTFSIDVDTASYSNMREYLMQQSAMPPADAVRIEELVNYFAYDYAPPTDDGVSDEGQPAAPFAAHIEVAACPWQADRRLVRVGLKGREIDRAARPPSNLVFLLDVSGSMNQPNKLPLLQSAMKVLVENLGENDRVAIVVYAGAAGLVLPSTTGVDKPTITAAIDQLQAGGSTAGGAGIRLAYKIAQDNFIKEGVNRMILCTDGDFNVGTTSPGDLERLVEEKAKSGTFLTVLGFGRGNLNDGMMEAISNRGNGNYHYIDNMTEARKVLVEELSGTLVTIAKDVKIQIEFNPAQVAAYRLIGYENRVLAAQDFNDDKKDAGEIGAGHTVTALYEIVPAGAKINTPSVDGLKYQKQAQPDTTETSGEADSDVSGELLTLKLRYKQPDGDTSTKLEFPVTDEGKTFAQASDDFKFASAVASFGMLLRGSKYAGNATYNAVAEIAGESVGADELGYRKEFLGIVRQANQVAVDEK